MGAKRKDQPAKVWLSRGGNLLNKIKGQRGLSRKIKKELLNLDKATKEGSADSADKALKELNSYKDKLGDDWGKWLTRTRQVPRDQERSRFYVSKTAYERVLSFTEQSEYEDNATQSIEQLFIALDSLGLNSISTIYDLQELLKPYSDTYPLNYSEETSPVTLFDLISGLLSELSTNSVTDFKDLSSIKKSRKEAKKLVIKSEEYKRSIETEVDQLKFLLRSKSNEANSLEKQLEAKETELGKLQHRLKLLDTPRKRTLAKKLASK